MLSISCLGQFLTGHGADFEMGGWYPFTDYAVWIDKPNENLLQCLTRKQQKDTLTFPGNGCKKEKEKKCFISNKNLVDSNYHWKNWIDWMSTKLEEKVATSKNLYTFFISKNFIRKWTQKLKNLKRMLRKSPASSVCAVIFKNADFSQSSLKVRNWANFSVFAYLKVSIIKR